MKDISLLDSNAAHCTEQIADMRNEINGLNFSQETFINDDDKTNFYTGLTIYSNLLTLHTLLSKYVSQTSKSKLTIWKEFIIVLMRLPQFVSARPGIQM